MTPQKLIAVTAVSCAIAMSSQAAYAEPANHADYFLASSSLPTMQLSTSDTSIAHKDPWVAVGLGVGTSLGAAAINGLVVTYQGTSPLPSVLVPVSILSVGLGHAYAGDPARGLWVSLGSIGALAVAVLAGTATYNTTGGHDSTLLMPIGAPAAVGMAVMAAYEAWAGYDAYHTAERANQATLAQR